MIRLFSNFLEISVFSLNVSAFLGLGLSIDYALLTVQRFREEMPHSANPAEAVTRALDTAGRAVWVSGLTVMVSMARAVRGAAAARAQRGARRDPRGGERAVRRARAAARAARLARPAT